MKRDELVQLRDAIDAYLKWGSEALQVKSKRADKWNSYRGDVDPTWNIRDWCYRVNPGFDPPEDPDFNNIDSWSWKCLPPPKTRYRAFRHTEHFGDGTLLVLLSDTDTRLLLTNGKLKPSQENHQGISRWADGFVRDGLWIEVTGERWFRVLRPESDIVLWGVPEVGYATAYKRDGTATQPKSQPSLRAAEKLAAVGQWEEVIVNGL